MSETIETVAEAKPAQETEAGSEPSSPSSTATSTTSSTPSPAPNRQPVKKQVKKKDKNDPTRFQGEGVNFNAKLIGVDDVPDARGDRMCQETIYRLKLSVKASGQHKQRIIVNVSEEGIKLIDLRTAVVNYTHAVHKISFISRDMTDGRAFGYIFGVGDGTHKFFGIKTEKAAENLVLTLRDLFQVVYEKKKKEMEEAKQKAKEEDQPDTTVAKAPEPVADPNVIKLGGDLTTESSTDDEPVYQVPTNGAPIEDSPEHIYAVPSNNAEVKVEKTGNNLVDLENELETIEQGIEQMNKFESEFDALAVGTAGTPATSPAGGSDPWGTGSTSQPAQNATDNSLFGSDFTNGGASTDGSAKSDLQDIDLFGTQPVVKGKDDIMNLFGPQNPQTSGFGPSVSPVPPAFGPSVSPLPQGFGPSVSPVPPAFAATPFPQQPFPAAPVGAPGQGVPNPFAPSPFGASQFPQAPPVPQRPMPSAVPPQSSSNPFGDDPFAPAQAGTGGFANFSNGSSQNATLFDEPLLAPVKVNVEVEPPSNEEKGKGDVFGDLCEIGTKDKSALSPKGLFAELSAQPKKSINQLRTEQTSDFQKGPKASDSDPFGSVDDASLPAAVDFAAPFNTNASDPFDTSYIQSNNQNATDSFQYSSSAKSNVKTLDFGDHDDFDLPSPEGPPPPLPTLPPPSDMLPIIPPAPPPRPSGSPAAVSSIPTLPPKLPNADSPPKLPPRNSVSNLQQQFTPLPRPRPKANCTKTSPPLPPRNTNSVSSNQNGQITESNRANLEGKPHNDNSLCSDLEKSRTSSVDKKFVIEDPFINSDPFAETDVFNSSFGGFSNSLSVDSFNSNDPFIFTSSQSQTNFNGNNMLDSKDDPFAVFDNCLNESFNQRSGNSRKNSKKKRNSTGCDETKLFDDFFDKQQSSEN